MTERGLASGLPEKGPMEKVRRRRSIEEGRFEKGPREKGRGRLGKMSPEKGAAGKEGQSIR